MAFSPHQIEDLRDRADIVSLVGGRVQLRKTGKDHQGLCPFHGERTPSFYVIPDKRIYHCFGCGETGDVFKFFMKLDGLGFGDALRHVAGASGIILEEEKHDPEEAKRRQHLDELAALLERSVKFYEQKLWHESGRLAREHLAKRGVKDDMARKFRLGFAGQGMDELARGLEKAQIPVPLAVEAGLIIESQRGGRPFDRFHGRLLVPIRIPRPPDGRTVALGGRFLEGVTPQRHDRKAAKYINSPETPLYKKGEVLYGLDQARDAIRRTERAVIVEGYFDVIGVHQAGLPVAVATCGTALTPAHLELLLRTGAKEVVFLFDGDAAGVRATQRAGELCAKMQVPARVAMLPDGLDPDDFARQRGVDALQLLLDRGRPAVEMLIDMALAEAGPTATVEERVRAVQAVKGIVLSAPDGLSRDLYIGQIAERMKVSDSAVRSVIEGRDEGPRPAPRAANPREPAGPREPHRRVPRPARPPNDDPFATESDDVPFEGRPPRDEFGNGEFRKGDWKKGDFKGKGDFKKGDFKGKGDWKRKEPPQPDRPPDPGAAKVAARRTYAAEEGITVALLKYPVLAQTVAQDAVLPEFTHAGLRAASEKVVALVAAGEPVDAPAIANAVDDAELRGRLVKRLGEDDGSLDDYARQIGPVLDKLRKELRRQRARTALETAKGLGTDEEKRRAFEEELQRHLEEARAVDRRVRERSGGNK